jgi:DNA-binding MarR family transcriptional regulator
MIRSQSDESLGFLIVDLGRLFRREFERSVAEAGLSVTAGEARTLLHASALAGGVRQNVLAERMHIEPMTLSNFIDRLEARGFVARKPDPADRRAKLVHVAGAATPLVERLRAISATVRERATGGLPPGDIVRLRKTLQAMRSNLGEALAERAA